MLETEVIELKEAFMSGKTKSGIVLTSLESKSHDMEVKLEQEVIERQSITKSHKKLERYL